MKLTSLLFALLVAASTSAVARAQHPLTAYPVQVLPLGDQPSDIAIGDVDEDGWPDVAIQTSENGALLLSDGHGALRFAGTLPLGVYAQAVALADADEDGHLDLVVIESGSSQNQLKVLAGDGHGAFELASSTALGTAGYDLLVVDGDEDGHLDVVITGASPAGIAFAAGLGDGSFGPLVQLHGPGSVPWNVQAGDVDEDGHLDLVVSFLVSHDLWVLRGNGEGAFVPDAHLLDVAETRYMALGELDGDGDLDVVVSSEIGANQSLGWFPGDGSGGFLPRQVLPNPANDWGPVRIADFDGDGDNDVVLGLDGSYLGAFDLQTAPGVFAAGPLWSLGGTTGALVGPDPRHARER